MPSRWAALGADRRAAWGRCRGSGREPYDTMVDHAEVAWRCSCPSRSQPCKHALALLAMWVRGQVPEAAAPAAVASWVAGHVRRDAAPDAPGAGGRHDRRASRRRRSWRPRPGPRRSVARLRDGLSELDRWLDDRIRTGLADPACALRHVGHLGGPPRRCPRRRPRQPCAPARRHRRHGPDWHEHVLTELGMLHLLAQAGQRVAELPPELADAVATVCGWQVRQADVLAGVPDTDTWIVAGRSDSREDRIEVRRTWLHGRGTRRWAMILSFAAYRQALDSSLAVGTAIEADLHRYPGVGLRALVGTVHGASPPDVVCSPPAAPSPTPATRSVGPWSSSRGPTICRRRFGRASPRTGAGGSSATTPARFPVAPEARVSRSCSPRRPARRSTSPSSGPPTGSYRSPSTWTTACSTSAPADLSFVSAA